MEDTRKIGFGKRLVAYLIDTTLLTIVLFMVIKLMIKSLFDGDDLTHELAKTIGNMVVLLSISLYLAYFTFMESSKMQATVGKIVMKIKVVNEKFEKLTFVNALGRSVSRLISGMIFGIGYLMVLFNKDKKALHDMIAKTYVVAK